MKHLTFLMLALFSAVQLSAQVEMNLTPNPKFGKPTSEELTMTTYAPDSTAAAVVLYNQTRLVYEWGIESFRLVTYHKVRIKVLKDEGTSYANVTIPYYEYENNRESREIVSAVEAASYNLENGKTVRTKMKREHLFRERISDTYMNLKFTVPQVRVGSVIEYEYKFASDFISDIKDWKAQQELPVFYTEYDLTVPQYFKFNLETRGVERLESEREEISTDISIAGKLLPCNASHVVFRGNQLSAIKKDEPYLYNPDNYSTQVIMDLKAVDFPDFYKNYTHTWEKIDELLIDDRDFGGYLRMNNPLKDEMAGLQLSSMESVEEKVKAILTLLKSKVKWNGSYSFYSKSIRDVMKEGKGNNASINFIFMSMLKDAGVEAYPVIMSRRDQAIIPLTHPSLNKLGTFLVAIVNPKGGYYYWDGSMEDGYLNSLPPVMQTDRARIVKSNGGSLWVNLQEVDGTSTRTSMQVTIDSDGKMNGQQMNNYKGQHATNVRRLYRTSKDSTEFITNHGKNKGVKIINYTNKGLNDFSPTIQEVITFEKQARKRGELLLINPMITPLVKKSIFTQTERKMPIELPYTYQRVLQVNITIPDGYVVDEIPQSAKLATKDGNLVMLYYIRQQGNQITLQYSFQQKQMLFAPQNYPDMKQFWESMAEKNQELIVLKKQQ